MNKGDTVTWTSQSQGSEKTKTGIVVAIISAGHRAMQHLPEDTKNSHVKFGSDVSIFDRVLVAVPAGKNGQITHYYCPRINMLQE
jgi:hypothetical protein